MNELSELLAEFPTRTLLDDNTERHTLYSNELNALIAVAEAADSEGDANSPHILAALTHLQEVMSR
jgi:hypothetical protein